MDRWTKERLAGAAHDALAAAGVRTLRTHEAGRRPLLELVVPHASMSRAASALDGLPWRWRYAHDARRPAGQPIAWSFDGGAVVVLRHRLPDAPWLPGTLRRLNRQLSCEATVAGVGSASTPLQIVRTSIEAARHGIKHGQLVDEVAELLCRPGAQDWHSMAARLGLLAPVQRIVDAAAGSAHHQPGPRSERVGRAVDLVLRRALPPSWDARRRAEPLEAPLVRVRFAGLELITGRGTFLPRGTSEQLLGAAEQALNGRRRHAVVVDVGTGCGAVALSLAHRRPGTRVVGTEVDETAASWARRNAVRLGIDMDVCTGSLLDPVPERLRGDVDVVCGNVPCVLPADFAAAGDAPAAAYVGGDADGLGLHRSLARAARQLLVPGGVLALQVQPWQWQVLLPELVQLGYVAGAAHGDEVAVVGTATWGRADTSSPH